MPELSITQPMVNPQNHAFDRSDLIVWRHSRSQCCEAAIAKALRFRVSAG